MYRPYWDAVVLRLAALEPASLLAQLSLEQLGVLASIVGLHRFLNMFQEEKGIANLKNTKLHNGCSVSLTIFFVLENIHQGYFTFLRQN